MTTAEIKNKLIAGIINTNSGIILKDLQLILEFNSSEDVYKLTQDQRSLLAESRSDYDNGNYITDEEANDNIDKWLGE